VIESNQFYESFSEPVVFDNQQNPIKIRIIPPKLANTITEKINFQFWFKCPQGVYPDIKNLMVLIFNQNPDTFYSLQIHNIDNHQNQNKQFKETRKSDMLFFFWTRVNLDLEMVNLNEKQFKFKLDSFIDDVPGFAIDKIFEEPEYWKVNVLEFILGQNDLSSKNVDL
jgi:hypothetical protein